MSDAVRDLFPFPLPLDPFGGIIRSCCMVQEKHKTIGSLLDYDLDSLYNNWFTFRFRFRFTVFIHFKSWVRAEKEKNVNVVIGLQKRKKWKKVLLCCL